MEKRKITAAGLIATGAGVVTSGLAMAPVNPIPIIGGAVLIVAGVVLVALKKPEIEVTVPTEEEIETWGARVRRVLGFAKKVQKEGFDLQELLDQIDSLDEEE